MQRIGMQTYRRSVGGADLAAALLVVGCGLLWLAVPSPLGKHRQHPRGLQTTKVSYCAWPAHDVEAFYATLPVGLPHPRLGFSRIVNGESRSFPAADAIRHPDMAVCLERKSEPVVGWDLTLRELGAGCRESAPRTLPGPEKKVYHSPKLEPDERRVRVAIAEDALKAGEFAPDAQILAAMETISEKPWTMAVWVETDAEGNVEHVFLETPSDVPAVNQKALDAVRRGRMTAKPDRARGLVTFVFSGAK